MKKSNQKHELIHLKNNYNLQHTNNLFIYLLFFMFGWGFQLKKVFS